jgi:hypothetical protein
MHNSKALVDFLSPRIYLLGAGIRFPSHLTFETVEVMEKCTHVFTNLPEHLLDRLDGRLRAKCVSLWSLYQDDRFRSDNYRDVIARVLDVASREKPVAWLSPGHPVIFDTVSAGLHEASSQRGWGIRAVASVSCIDTLLADLGYDPAQGLLIHDATTVVRSRIALCPCISTLLLQPSVFDSDLPQISSTSQAPTFTALGEYLCQYYPAHHRLGFLRSSTDFRRPHKATWVNISEFESLSFTEVRGSSLFIPALPIVSSHDRM